MPEMALGPRKWSPKVFARARMEGATLADAARVAGSHASEANLKNVGWQYERHPKVRAIYAALDPSFDALLAQVPERLGACLRGEKSSGDGAAATWLDQLSASRLILQATGRLVQRVEVTHSAPLKVKGFRTRVVDAEVVERAALEGGALGGGDAGDGGEEP
jgi:hypothetical protein